MLGLMCRCFSLDFAAAKPIFFSDPFFNLDWKRALFDSTTGEMRACLTIVPTTVRIGVNVDATLTMAGIAGVCTDTEHRGKGYARALLADTIQWLGTSTDFYAACLTAEHPKLYESLGWVRCSKGVKWNVHNCRTLPSFDEGRDVRILSSAAAETLAPRLHELYSRSRNGSRAGSFVRDERRWRCIERLTNGRKVAVYQGGESIEAYLAFDVRNASDERIGFIHEMVALNDSGRRALIGFLASGKAGEKLQGQCRDSDLVDFGLLDVPGLVVETVPNIYIQPTNIAKLKALFERHGLIVEDTPDSVSIYTKIEPYLALPDIF